MPAWPSSINETYVQEYSRGIVYPRYASIYTKFKVRFCVTVNSTLYADPRYSGPQSSTLARLRGVAPGQQI